MEKPPYHAGPDGPKVIRLGRISIGLRGYLRFAPVLLARVLRREANRPHPLPPPAVVYESSSAIHDPRTFDRQLMDA
jgi:hypothetical protein